MLDVWLHQVLRRRGDDQQSKCVKIFPRKQIGAVTNSIICDALRLFLKITTKYDQLAFLNKRTADGHTEQYIGSYLERETGLLQD